MPFLLDDFRDPAQSACGTRWEAFTDRVMGGVSAGEAAIVTVDGRPALRLSGRVRLENNGGFIQAALPLAPGRGALLDAAAWRGVRALVRGRAPAAFLHLRTADTTLPWQHYAAPLPLDAAWRTVDVPFDRFAPAGLARPLDARRLLRLGVVAAKAAGPVELYVARLELA